MPIAINRPLAGILVAAAGGALVLAALALWPSGSGPEQARAQADPQAEAASDGHISWEEYESAVWRAFECIEDAGFEPMAEPHLNAAGTNLAYAFFANDGAGGGKAVLSCQEDNSMYVEQLWAHQNQPSAETRAVAEAAMDECLVTGGYDAAEVSAAEFFSAFEGRDDGGTYFECLRQVSIDYRVGWWAGD
ncbi:MAG: hypothetical protein AB7N24_05230 [Dehalococcoidia bacterium]